MKNFEIENYQDIKAIACIKKLKMGDEVPTMLGYKSRWGLKTALNNPKKKQEILEKANKIFKKL